MPPARDPATARAAQLEKQIRQLRASMTAAARRKDAVELASVRSRLRAVQREWEDALDAQLSASGRIGEAGAKPGANGDRIVPTDRSGVPVREQVVESLMILGAPAAPRLVSAVHDAFFDGRLPAKRFSSLRRDEERSFTKSPNLRPHYVCAALSADGLTAVRGLLAISTWTLEQRVIGPLSPRVDFLTQAIGISERIRQTRRPSPEALRLLHRFAQNIPGAIRDFAEPDPETVIRSAQSELDVHAGSDRATRRAAASRARKRLDDARQLFG